MYADGTLRACPLVLWLLLLVSPAPSRSIVTNCKVGGLLGSEAGQQLLADTKHLLSDIASAPLEGEGVGP